MSTRRSTKARSKATVKTAVKTGAAATAATPEPAESITSVVVTENPAADAGPELKKQELLDKVVTRTDVKKKLAKPVVEAVLEILGEALAEGRELNLQPLGKVKINRIKEMANARVIVAKIRQPKAGGARAINGPDGGEEDPMKDQVAQGAD